MVKIEEDFAAGTDSLQIAHDVVKESYEVDEAEHDEGDALVGLRHHKKLPRRKNSPGNWKTCWNAMLGNHELQYTMYKLKYAADSE